MNLKLALIGICTLGTIFSGAGALAGDSQAQTLTVKQTLKLNTDATQSTYWSYSRACFDMDLGAEIAASECEPFNQTKRLCTLFAYNFTGVAGARQTYDSGLVFNVNKQFGPGIQRNEWDRNFSKIKIFSSLSKMDISNPNLLIECSEGPSPQSPALFSIDEINQVLSKYVEIR